MAWVPRLPVVPGVAFTTAGDGVADPSRPRWAASAGDGAVDRGADLTRSRWADALPPRPAFAVAEDLDGVVATVVVTGEIDLATAPEVQRRIEAHAGAPRLVVDLSAVRFLDSSAMAVLVRATHRAAQSGQDLVLRAPAETAVLRVLDISGLLTALPFERAGRR